MALKLLKTEVDTIVDKIVADHKKALSDEKKAFVLPKASVAECKKIAKQLHQLPDWAKNCLSYNLPDKDEEDLFKSLLNEKTKAAFVSKVPKLKSEIDLRIEVQMASKFGDFTSIQHLLQSINKYES